ncbi:MAG TPA: hypothetical protein VIN03_00340 [Roseateles sp.]
MSSELLKWLASGLIAAVLASALWMAHALRHHPGGTSLMLAQVASPTAGAASAPVTATR